MRLFFKYILITIIVNISVNAVAQEANIQKDSFAPLHSVPEWIKTKTTPEEYQLWMTMSRIYKINYSFLNETISKEKRQNLYDDIRVICDSIEAGKYVKYKGGLFVVQLIPRTDTTLNWRNEETIQIDEHIRYCKQKAIIYQSVQKKTVYLECIVWYIYNSLNKEVYIIKYETSSPLAFSRFLGNLHFSFLKEANELIGSCSGTLQYCDERHEYHGETFTKTFSLKL